tara:strand:+ start:260 stop:424 length:165 start_codon:yes stop_codon:yes gene_type:complete
MDKQKLIKLVSIVTGTLLLIFIMLFLLDQDWENAFVFSLLFIALWIFPAYLNKK